MSWFSFFAAYFKGLFASSAIIITLLVGSASSFVSSFSSVSQTALPSPAPSSSSVSIASSTSPLASSTPQKIKPAAAAATVATAAPHTPAPAQTLPAVVLQPAPLLSTDAVNTEARASIVNILCTTASGGTFEPISGSGVIIDSRGVILTNAHVGQFFLLKDFPQPGNVACVIRTGSPAEPIYHAELLYLPPPWIDANASQITSAHATGTGENDYAFLLITSTTNGNALPSSFPAIPMSGENPATGDQELVAAYPAGFLDGITIQENLYSSSALATVGQLYTFSSTDDVDLISLGGTVVSQSGSSGGAVVRTYDGKLTGIVATASVGTTTSSRDLRAITLAHIDRSLRSLGEGGLAEFLSQDLNAQAAQFASSTAPEETQKLIAAIPGY